MLFLIALNKDVVRINLNFFDAIMKPFYVLRVHIINLPIKINLYELKRKNFLGNGERIDFLCIEE